MAKRAMPHSYSNLLTHIVYSTKNRKPFIDAALEVRLFPYFGGIVRQLWEALSRQRSGGPRPPSRRTASDHRRCRSDWQDQRKLDVLDPPVFPEQSDFAWQRGYAAFSISKSKVTAVAKYIEGQKEHHRKQSFQDEFLELLRRHGVAVNEKYLWT